MSKSINEIFDEGNELYDSKNYKEALKKFKEAKELNDLRYIHSCDYAIGSIYDDIAETQENPEKKKKYYKKAAKSFQNVADRHPQYKGIDEKIGTSLFKAEEPQEALRFFEKTPAVTYVNQIKQQLGSLNNLNELVSFNPENYQNLIPQDYTSHNKSLYEIVFKIISAIIEELRIHKEEIIIIKQDVNNIKNILMDADILTIADINRKIKYLAENNSKLYTYYENFNSGLQNIYLASCAADSGTVVLDSGHLERVNFSSIEKGGCYLLDIFAAGYFGPIVSGAVAVFHDLGDNAYNSYAERKLANTLKTLNTVINQKYDITMKPEQSIQQIALFITELKKDEILNIQENTADGFLSFIAQKILPTQKKIFFRHKDKEIENDPILKLVFQDLSALIFYIEDHSKEMIEQKQKSFLAQIVDIAKTELNLLWENKVKNNPANIIEYNLLQIENNLSEFNTITQKMKSGQWYNLALPYISFNPCSIYFLRLSWSGEQRGIEKFCTKEYYKEECKKKNIPINNDDLDHFMLLLLYKMCKVSDENIRTFKDIIELEKTKASYEKNILTFAKNNPDIIKLASTKAPQLFVTENNIELCIENEEDQKKAKEILKLNSSDQYVENCLKKICPVLACNKGSTKLILEESKPEPELSSIPFNLDSPRSDDDDKTVVILGVY